MDDHFISERWNVKIAKNAKIHDRIQKRPRWFLAPVYVFSHHGLTPKMFISWFPDMQSEW